MSTQEEISRSKRCYSDEQSLISTIQLPEHMLYQIFLRLPVKSLIRFRCLSKGMRVMIDSPIFVKNHNNYRSECERSLPPDDYAILLGLYDYSPMFSVNFYKDNMNCAKAIELNCTLREGMSAIGGCNGIFCFMYALPESYVFWNPSNGTCRKVECSDLSSQLVCSISSIGYDHVINDYKIFRFADMPINTVMKIYSFRNDSWKEFTGKLPFDTFRPFGTGICVSGAMHWLAYPTNSSIFIAAFDFVTETFESLPLPVEALKPYGITDFGGRLCITFYSSVYDNGANTLWVMEKYGVERSWTKLYNIDCLQNFYYPNKEERRLLYHSGRLTWWDPQHNSFERIEFTGPMDDQPEPFVYVGTSLDLIRVLFSEPVCCKM